MLIFWIFRKLMVGHHKCHKVWHDTIVNGFMPWFRFVFDTACNTCSHCLKYVIEALPSIFLLIVIFNLYLLIFSSKYSGLTLDSSRVFVGNHGPHLPLSKISVLLIIPNVTWYKSNQHTNITICLFPLAVINLVVCLFCLSESSISDKSSRTKDVFWPILVDLAPASCPLCCLLNDDIPAPELFYSVVRVVTQDKLHMMDIIPRLVVCSICNFAIWSQSSTSLLFSWQESYIWRLGNK